MRLRHGRRRCRRVTAAFIATASAFVAVDAGFPLAELFAEAAFWLAVWIAGDRTRLRRERIAELEQRVQQVEREAERDRRLAAAEERTRIARELHDSVGHAMNVILVEAGAARLLRDRDPPRSRSALETIEQIARSTIEEIDRLVRHLREHGRQTKERMRRCRGCVTSRRSSSTSVRPGGRSRLTWRARRRPPARRRGPGRVPHRPGSADQRRPSRQRQRRIVVHYGPRALEVSVTNALRPARQGPAARDAAGGASCTAVGDTASSACGSARSLLGGTLEARGVDGVFVVRALLPYRGEPA